MQVRIDDAILADIAGAIRQKLGGSTLYRPSQMAAAIRSITTPSDMIVTVGAWYHRDAVAFEVTASHQMEVASAVAQATLEPTGMPVAVTSEIERQ